MSAGPGGARHQATDNTAAAITAVAAPSVSAPTSLATSSPLAAASLDDPSPAGKVLALTVRKCVLQGFRHATCRSLAAPVKTAAGAREKLTQVNRPKATTPNLLAKGVLPPPNIDSDPVHVSVLDGLRRPFLRPWLAALWRHCGVVEGLGCDLTVWHQSVAAACPDRHCLASTAKE